MLLIYVSFCSQLTSASSPLKCNEQESDSLVQMKHNVLSHTDPLEVLGHGSEHMTCTPANLSPSSSLQCQTQNPRLPPQSTAPLLSTSRCQNKRKFQDSEPSNLAKQIKPLSYATSIASVIENLVRMCPEQHKPELGLFILESAHKKFANIKSKNSPPSEKENIVISVTNAESNPKL